MQCDQKRIRDATYRGWSKWLPWKVEGLKNANKLHATWILSRRRFCIDQRSRLTCVIEEIQSGHCKDINISKNKFFDEIHSPICAHEKSFETCDIEIVP